MVLGQEITMAEGGFIPPTFEFPTGTPPILPYPDDPLIMNGFAQTPDVAVVYDPMPGTTVIPPGVVPFVPDYGLDVPNWVVPAAIGGAVLLAVFFLAR